MRRPIARIPRPDGTPLPTARLDAEQRGMIVTFWKPFVWANANGFTVNFDYAKQCRLGSRVLVLVIQLSFVYRGKDS